MATWNQLIDQAFIDLAVIQPGQSVAGTGMQTEAQPRLNSMLQNWSAQKGIPYTQVLQTFNLSSGVASYTLGSGGTWATTGGLRAQKVGAWRAVNGVWTMGGQALSMEEFDARAKQAVIDFTSASAQAQTLLAPFAITPSVALSNAAVPFIVGADTAYPLINVRVFPTPLSGGSMELGYWTPFTVITDFTVDAALPPGYEDAIHFNLAVAMYPQYARQGGLPPELAANAQNTLGAIVGQNAMAAPAAPAGVNQ